MLLMLSLMPPLPSWRLSRPNGLKPFTNRDNDDSDKVLHHLRDPACWSPHAMFRVLAHFTGAAHEALGSCGLVGVVGHDGCLCVDLVIVVEAGLDLFSLEG